MTIRSTLDGVVSQVLVPNGEPAEAGAPLARIGGSQARVDSYSFVNKPAAPLVNPVPTAVQFLSGERIDIERLGARFVGITGHRTRLPDRDLDCRRARPGLADAMRLRRRPICGRGHCRQRCLATWSGCWPCRGKAVVDINTRPYVSCSWTASISKSGPSPSVAPMARGSRSSASNPASAS